MVGDIDFIFSKEDYPKAIRILRDFGYSEVNKQKYYKPEEYRHYRRLQKESNIVAIEIHSDFLNKKIYNKEFNYKVADRNSQIINEFRVLSYANKINLSIIANQINDNGFSFKTMALRNAYDVFLLSKKTNVKDALNSLDKLSHPLNCFLAACYEVFNNVLSLEYNKTKKTTLYLRCFYSQFTKRKLTKRQSKFNKSFLITKERLIIIYKCLIYKAWRVWLFNLITDKDWQKRKLIQLGIKK